MKILELDIEASPNLAYVWGLWQQNVSLKQLVVPTEIISWAAKWYGVDGMHFSAVFETSRKQMMKRMWKLLDEADAVMHYNGTRFDIPHINREFLKHGMSPPSPYKQIDLLKTAKQVFKFPSNKLEYVADVLGVGNKLKHQGFDLWTGVMRGDPACCQIMKDYNIQDVLLLEEVYDKIRPWIKNHVSYSYLQDSGEKHVCTRCGSDALQKRGHYSTLTSVFQRFRCKNCGAWSRDNTPVKRKKYKTREL